MIFNSLQYAVFLPIVFLIFWYLPERFRCYFILLASYIFYMCWRWEYIFLIIAVTLLSWMSGIIIEKRPKNKKIFFFGTLLILLFLLILFKYYVFLWKISPVYLHYFILKYHFQQLKYYCPLEYRFIYFKQ